MKITRILALTTVIAALALPISAQQQYAGTPQVQELLGVMDQISAMGAAAQRDAQRQAALASARVRYEQQLRQARLRRLIARTNANARSLPAYEGPSLSEIAFQTSVDLGIRRNLQILEQVMGPVRQNYHTAVYGTPEEIAQMTRRLSAQGQLDAGAAAQQQTRNSVAQYQARVSAANEWHRVIQDANAAESYAQSVLNERH